MSALPQTMRALSKSRPAPGLDMIETATPAIGPTDVLIAVDVSAICGTDLHIWQWDAWAAATIPTPMVVGHEFVGRVVAVGEAVTRVSVGERATAEGHVVCGRCRNCRAGREHYCRETLGIGVNRPGSFAEYVAAPEHNVYPIPDTLPDSAAAILDPYGNAVHTALSFDLTGEDVLIAGAGPIGCMATAVCQRVGARHVVATDLSDTRLRLAAAMGATRTVNVTKESLADAMAELGMREGFDVGLEMSGAPAALRQMIDNMNHGGRIALLGILPADAGVDWTKVVFKSLTLKGVYGREMFETWYKGLALLSQGLSLDPIITHRLPIDRFAEGFELMASGDCGKVLLDWRAAP